MVSDVPAAAKGVAQAALHERMCDDTRPPLWLDSYTGCGLVVHTVLEALVETGWSITPPQPEGTTPDSPFRLGEPERFRYPVPCPGYPKCLKDVGHEHWSDDPK